MASSYEIKRTVRSVLVINPNCSKSMTEALKPLIESLGYDKTAYTCFTADSGVDSINNAEDAARSAFACFPDLTPLIPSHDAFLVACYSEHPLVAILKSHPAIQAGNKPVTGIFESSVTSALTLVKPTERFGIVSTGVVWEDLLSTAVRNFLGTSTTSTRFAGVQTTSLSAAELHFSPPELVRQRLKEATKRLVLQHQQDGLGEVGAICLGCAGMSGMDAIVRESCIETLGAEKGSRVWIIDGVVAGVNALEGALRSMGR